MLFTLLLLFGLMEIILRYTPKPVDYLANVSYTRDMPYSNLQNDKNLEAKVKIDKGVVVFHPDFKKYLDTRKKENTFRIVVIGDSYTFGIGVERNETYTYFLEKKLNQDKNKLNYEVLNFGIPGYDLTQINSLFQEQVPYFNPDLVIYGYYINDPETVDYAEKNKETIKLIYGLKRAPYLLEHPYNNWLLENLAVYKFVNLRLSSIIQRIEPEYEPKIYLLSEKESTNALDQMIKTCNKNSIPFYILKIPEILEKIKDPFIDPLITKNNIKHLDLEPKLKEYEPEEILLGNKTKVTPYDRTARYFSKEGHQIVAEMIYQDLKKQGIIR